MNDFSVFFVADGLKLERKAWMLAVSLRKEMGFEFPVIAYVPENKMGQVSAMSRAIFKRCAVEIRAFDTSVGKWETPYIIGNKILASMQRRETSNSIFLDTDTVCLRSLDFPRNELKPYLAAVPEGVMSWGKERRGQYWEAAYAVFDLEVPEERVKLVRGRQRSVPPYFNAGFVAFREQEDDNGLRFPDVWYDTAVRIDHDAAVLNRRPWLDQISLPIAAVRMGVEVIVLDESYNYSLHRRPVDPDIDARLLHYHQVSSFNMWPQCRSVLDTAIEWLPENKRGHLKRHLRRWRHSS